MQRTILVADDEQTIREPLAELCRDHGFMVVTAADGNQALERLQQQTIDIALLDIRMPGPDGLEVLVRSRQTTPGTQVIIITAFGSVQSAVEAIKLGASDYVSKPVDFDDLLAKIDRLLNLRRLADENRFLRGELESRYGLQGIVGDSPALHGVLKIVQKLAQTRTSALITGESGTGKEVIARAIHYGGITRRGQFVAVNCAALPETLVESELFGHKRGAFTGVVDDKPGRFEVADGGTIFLDEISAMPVNIQAKLLRAIEEKSILPIGGTESIKVDVRILCATNHVLKDEVQEGRFREDLYYRLNVVEIHIPPLRVRRRDIPLLANHFVAKYSQELAKACHGVSDRAMQAMMVYDWPGNVRELENVIERGVIFAEGRTIGLADLPFTVDPSGLPTSGRVDLKTALRAFEKEHISSVLHENDFDKNATARDLGIGLSSLYRKMDELGIPKREPDAQENGRGDHGDQNDLARYRSGAPVGDAET